MYSLQCYMGQFTCVQACEKLFSKFWSFLPSSLQLGIKAMKNSTVMLKRIDLELVYKKTFDGNWKLATKSILHKYKLLY